MLDVKQQKVVQENMSLNKSGIMDFTGLEVSMTTCFSKSLAQRYDYIQNTQINFAY